MQISLARNYKKNCHQDGTLYYFNLQIPALKFCISLHVMAAAARLLIGTAVARAILSNHRTGNSLIKFLPII